MYECPACKQRVIPFSHKWFGAQPAEYQCENCKARLTTGYGHFFPIWFIFGVVWMVASISSTYFSDIEILKFIKIITGALWALSGFYFMFRAKVIVIKD